MIHGQFLRQCCAAFIPVSSAYNRGHCSLADYWVSVLRILWKSLQMPLGSSVITVKGQGDPGLRLQLNHNTWSSFLFFVHSNLKHLPTGQSFYKYVGIILIASMNCLWISFGRLVRWSLVRVQQGAGVWADVVVFMDSLVQVQRLSINTDPHAAAVGRWHQRGHQRNIW